MFHATIFEFQNPIVSKKLIKINTEKKFKKSDINTPNSDNEKSIEFPQNIRDLYNCDWQEQGHNFGVNPKFFQFLIIAIAYGMSWFGFRKICY